MARPVCGIGGGSRTRTPGGGSVSALAGGAGCGLGTNGGQGFSRKEKNHRRKHVDKLSEHLDAHAGGKTDALTQAN